MCEPRGGRTAWVRWLPRLSGRGWCQEAQALRWPRRPEHPVASVTHWQDRKGMRERGPGAILCWASLFLEFCGITVAWTLNNPTPVHPDGTNKKGNKRKEPSVLLASQGKAWRDCTNGKPWNCSHISSHWQPAAWALWRGCSRPTDRAGRPMAGSAEQRASAFPLCFLEVTQRQQEEWK